MAEISLDEGQIIVFIVPNATYESDIERLIVAAAKKYDDLCYVSMNKPYTTLGELFAKKGVNIEKILFIDCVTGKISGEKGYNIVSVSSPKALTELSISISQVLGKAVDAFVFDSLSTLLAYQDNATSIKFVHSIVSKVRNTKKKWIFLCLAEDAKSDLMKDIGMFVDKIVAIK